ncbi:hypothetical protein GE09DRAFT_1274351, partial [Coniochaeta sp. 2T2.1]
MDNTHIYAIGFGSLFIILHLIFHLRCVCPRALQPKSFPSALQATQTVSYCFSRHLTYRTLIRRRKFIGHWSWTKALLLLIYLGVNICCLLIPFPGTSQAGLRAGTLSLINMILMFAGPHLSFVADALGVSLGTYRYLHLSAGLVSFVLASFHAVVVTVHLRKVPLDVPENLFALLVIIAM